MKFRRNETPKAEMQFAPMIDVVFLLLIFFIVTWSFAKRETELDIDIPVADSGTDPERNQYEIVINIRKDGAVKTQAEVLYTDEEVRTVLGGMLARIHEVNPDQSVIVRGDRKTEWENIVRVLDVCQAAGIWNVAFSTDKPKESGSGR